MSNLTLALADQPQLTDYSHITIHVHLLWNALPKELQHIDVIHSSQAHQVDSTARLLELKGLHFTISLSSLKLLTSNNKFLLGVSNGEITTVKQYKFTSQPKMMWHFVVVEFCRTPDR